MPTSMSTVDLRLIELALICPVYCDDCDWHGATKDCRNFDGWLSCPKCEGHQIFETYRRVIH